MRRTLALVAMLVLGCANGHHNGGSADSATIDSTGSGAIDSPTATPDSPDTVDSPPGTPDSPVAMVDSPPGTPDAPGTVDAPGTPDAPGTVDSRPPDANVDANNCTVQPCTLAPQCGCPANQTCDLDPTTGTSDVCRAINTPGKDTNTCASFSECDHGYVCVGDGTNNACKEYCASTADCAGPRGQCVIGLVDSTGAWLPTHPTVCSSDCDPSASAAAYCPANWKCGIFTATYPPGSTTTYDIADCEIAGAGGQGSNCKVGTAGDDTKCMAQYSCITTDSGTTYTCQKVCDVTALGLGAVCPGVSPTAHCTGFNPALKIGTGHTYGVCL